MAPTGLKIKTGKRGQPERENPLAGLNNLDTGEPAAMHPVYYPSMRAAAHALKIDIAILRDARDRACPAFGSNSAVHRIRLLEWLKDNSEAVNQPAATPQPNLQQEESEEDYTVDTEAGGVGRTLKSLQQYERRAKRALDAAERMPPSPMKSEAVKAAQDAWIKIVNALLKYDLSVSLAKRESGELIPLVDAVKGVQALLAWHTVATSDALRNVVPDCEGKAKYEIAKLLDTALRSSIYRNFKSGMKIGKIPDWMGREASDFVKKEAPLSLDAPKPLTMEDF